MGFRALPNEVVLMIIEKTYADDIESLAMINKSTWQLSQDYLAEHQRVKARYSRVNCGANQVETPANLVTEICRNPRIRHAIKRLNIHDWRTEWPINQGMPADYPVDLVAELEDGNHMFYTHRDSEAEDALLGGDETIMLAAMISFLPRLEMLEIDVGSRDATWLFHTFRSRRFRQDLCTLHVRDTVKTIYNADLVKQLLTECSFGTVVLEGLQINRRISWLLTNHNWTERRTLSLTFIDCRISFKTLCSILDSRLALKSFAFHADDSAADYIEIDPYFIRAALQKHKDTLESLTILGFHRAGGPDAEDDYHYLGSLEDFNVLKNISTNAELL